jgi:UDP-GlcNAc:undecaprenyl-phosphate GlcNAc-1-phosphate transferase
MSILTIFLIFSSLFLLILLYFKIADHFNIVDQPNHRSSHNTSTIRGGGIIFTIAAIFFFVMYGFSYPWFMLGLVLITLISFVDDIFTLKNSLRLSIHLLAVVLLAFQLELWVLPWYWIVIAFIFVIGTINAYNFMDGINGITGSYSLLLVLTLFYINTKVIAFTSEPFLIIVGLALMVFNFFNFRGKARCFAGDVGSVSIAFLLIFFVAQLILTTGNLTYLLLLLWYGLDVVTTIGFRIIRKENIFEAHRSHFYQYLANERKWPHLWVSCLYVFIQLLINIVLLIVVTSLVASLAFIVVLAVLFIGVRFWLEGKHKLLNVTNQN